FFQAEDGIRDFHVTGVQTCALPISRPDVELRVSHNGKASRRYRAFDGSGGALFTGERLVETLGEEFAKQALRVEHEGAGLRLHEIGRASCRERVKSEEKAAS